MKYKQLRRVAKYRNSRKNSTRNFFRILAVLTAVWFAFFQGTPMPSRDYEILNSVEKSEVIYPHVEDGSHIPFLIIIVSFSMNKLINLYFYKKGKTLPEKIDWSSVCKWKELKNNL